ncbi:MAG: TIGR01212 family radical SAM protein [Tenericutes bacterium]|jgi:radical SAM protein (TIGR01212 family)|nr:TIGR01212 family radical SAM protein [Mycoplasmatota bacterium]
MNYFTNEKHYNTLNNYYRSRFNSKVMKIALNGNFSCPNRDGIFSDKGCIFCSEAGSGDFAGDKFGDLPTQFNEIKTMMHQKWKTGKYIAYFQANTNTYGPIKKLETLFNEALSLDEDIIGLNIGTRADCFSPKIYDLLEEINQKTYLTIELGLQSMHNETLKLINRGHDRDTFSKTVKALRKRNIDVVAHIINGLPGENEQMMMDTIQYLNGLGIQGIKIHMLYLLKNTPLETLFKNNPFHILTLEEYVNITVKQLRLLRNDIIVHRITGDPPRDLLIKPEWTLKKFVVTNEIDKLMRKNTYYQGDLYHE